MDERELVEELKRGNRELLALYDVNRLLQTRLSTEEKLYIVLTSLTADDAFRYNRAYLFLTNENKNTLEGWLGVGPLSGDEARAIWEGVAALEDGLVPAGQRSVAELLERSPFEFGVREFVVPIRRGQGYPVQTVVSRRPKLVRDVASGKDRLHPEFARLVSCSQVAFIPLLSRKRVLGVMAVESSGADRAINDGRLRTLTLFGNLAAIALENAELYRTLEVKVESLERVNRELQEAQAKIMQLDRLCSMGAIAAGVAHEIKNPLNSLIINLDLLADELPESSAEARKLMRIVEKESMRLSETVMDFLSYSTAARLSPVCVHPHGLLDQVLNLVEVQGENLGIDVVREYGEGVTEVMVDEKRMRQAFLNVIINAMQAMPGGGTLTVRTAREVVGDLVSSGGSLCVEIRDTGRGIKNKHIGRLFDPFYTTKKDGTGMGLPIVDSIVRSHGGRVDIKSREGKGTSVMVVLPVHDLTPDDAGRPAGDRAARAEQPG